jgi:hypothetical protein
VWGAEQVTGAPILGRPTFGTRKHGPDTDPSAHTEPVRGLSAGTDGCAGRSREVQAARREYSLITPPSRWRRMICPRTPESTVGIGLSRPSPRCGRARL